MFTTSSNPWIIGLNIVILGIAGIFVISYAIAQWKKGASEAESSTINTALAEIKILKETVQRLDNENKTYAAQLNQLIGENKALKDLLTYQDPNFRKTIESILLEIKKLREDFEKHTVDDDLRFKTIGDTANENNQLLKKIKEV